MANGCSEHVKLSSSGRRAVAPGVTATETFRQKIVQRFDSDYLLKAENHSCGRNSAAAHLFALLSLLRNLDVYQRESIVTWDGAYLQAISGDNASNAAHRLPCQIIVDGKYPWDLPARKNMDIGRVAIELRTLVGDVWVLPKVFNAADSIAEHSCLRSALVEACKTAITETAPIQREAGVLKRGTGIDYGLILLTTDEVSNPHAGIDHAAVRTAYAVWVEKSIAAFTRAIQNVRQDGATVNGKDCSEDVIYILERYIRFAAERPSLFSGANLFRMEESLWQQEPQRVGASEVK
jgi:hypothetical protein